MLFPIYIYEPGTALPTEGTYYILGRDGLYLHRDYGLIRATVRIPEVAALNQVWTEAELRLPPIPKELVWRVMHFFRTIYAELKSEVVVLIFWNEAEQRYKITPPRQTVSRASIHYDKALRIPGHLLVGSIHAHADFNAFHSITDHGDEENFDGLHVTIGHLDEATHDISCQVVVNGNRFPVPPGQYLEGLARAPEDGAEIVANAIVAIGEAMIGALAGPDLREIAEKSREPKLPRFIPALPKGILLVDCLYPIFWRNMVEVKKHLHWIKKVEPLIKVDGVEDDLTTDQVDADREKPAGQEGS